MTMTCRISRYVVTKDKGDYSNATNVVVPSVKCRIMPNPSYRRRRGDDAGNFENMRYAVDAVLTVPTGTDLRRGDVIQITNEEGVVTGSEYVVTGEILDDSQWNPCLRATVQIMRN